MHWIPESGKRCPAECGLETLSTSTPCDATCRLYPQNALRISFHCPETMLGTSCDMSVGFFLIRMRARLLQYSIDESNQMPADARTRSVADMSTAQLPRTSAASASARAPAQCLPNAQQLDPSGTPGDAVATAGASRDAKHVTTDAVPLRNRLARVYLCRRLLDKPARRLRHVENGTRFASGSVSR